VRLRALLAPLALFALAVAVRWPYHATIPAPTDETDELLLALSILRHGAHPLTANEPYLGPLPIYLTALAYALVGPSFAAGRAVAVLLGALIAPATWALGVTLGGRRAGLIAGLLAACAFGPVVIGSHVAWGHGLAPAMVALAVALLIWASRSGRGVGYFACGVVTGLAVGAHPTVLALIPGAAVWWARTAMGTRRARGVALAWLAIGCGVSYAPILALLATRGLAPFRAHLALHEYVGPGAGAWLPGVGAWLDGFVRNLAGPAQSSLADPRLWAAGGLLIVGMAVAARTSRWLPAAVVISGALLMPLMVAGEKYLTLTGLRYPAPALPLALAAVGVALAEWRHAPTRRWAPGAIIVVTVLVQLVALGAFYADVMAHGVSGAPVQAIADGLTVAARGGATVFVDDGFDTKLGGGGEVGRAVRTMLTLTGVEHTVAKVDKLRWFLKNGNGATYDLVLTGDTATELGREFVLEPRLVVPVVPGQVSRSGDRWGWYRYHTPPVP
jgi:hypothetical protein